MELVYNFDMGAFGPNYGPNFNGIVVSTPTVFIPTKKVTADLCANTSVKENLCVTDSIKADLCN